MGGRGSGGGGVSAAVRQDIEMENRIVSAYRDVMAAKENQRNPWVDLADIRQRVGGDRAEVDAAIKRLVRSRRGVQLESEMNGSAITSKMRAAAVRLGGENNHYIGWVRGAKPTLKPVPRQKP